MVLVLVPKYHNAADAAALMGEAHSLVDDHAGAPSASTSTGGVGSFEQRMRLAVASSCGAAAVAQRALRAADAEGRRALEQATERASREAAGGNEERRAIHAILLAELRDAESDAAARRGRRARGRGCC